MKYQNTLLEDWIENFYIQIDIHYPSQLCLESIARKLGIFVAFRKITSRIYEDIIIIDNRLNIKQQWEEFAHEICHFYRQDGNQLIMHKEFLELQEAKAENFALHFCVPTFMLLNYEITNYCDLTDGIPFVMETFNVTEDFAKRRLIHFRNQIQQAISDEQHRKYMESRYSKAPPYSMETKNILNKLNILLEKKKKGVTL